ncbi:MAG: hypothetical protein IT423_16675 [Pirellulaceae bacterium]|nr:hypothetical protein [Pirellulaceae bacterium]
MQTDDPILNIACNPVPNLNAGMLECPVDYESVAWVRVPVVQNPITYRNVRLPLNEQVTQVGLNSIGWQIYIFRVNSGPASPTISPMCVPKCSPEPTDRALAVSIVLPHGKSSQQFWVPVIEQVGYAQLQTDRWLVVIIRVPVEGIPLPPVHNH